MSNIDSIFVDVPSFGGAYKVNRLGELLTVKTGRKRFITNNKNAYILLTLKKGKTIVRILAHRLIAMTFIPNPDNLPVINHIDEIKGNNLPANLEWCTQSHNFRHSFVLKTKRSIDEIIKTEKQILKIFGITKQRLERAIERDKKRGRIVHVIERNGEKCYHIATIPDFLKSKLDFYK